MFLFDISNEIFNYLFSNNFWIFAFFIGFLILIPFGVLAFALGMSRRSILKNPPQIPLLERYPMVSVIMCCKGIHDRSFSNFSRNLQMKYKGELEFIFVVESLTDPVNEQIHAAIDQAGVQAQVIVAGLSYHNAQKIHNMMKGVTNTDPRSEYVLFIDDDVYLYSGLIDELVYPHLEEPDKILLSTGYEFIAPPKNASIACYSLLIYRLHNLLGFITSNPILVWGGCWFGGIRLFKENFENLVDCYLDGGYSDDTIVSTIVKNKGYICHHPFRAAFPSQPIPDLSFEKVSDFLKRQFFVLATYPNSYQKIIGWSLAFLLCSSSFLMAIWSVISPLSGILAFFGIFSKEFSFTYQHLFAILSIFVWIGFYSSAKWTTGILTQVANSIRSEKDKISFELNFFRFYLGASLYIIRMPFIVADAMTCDSIVWSGVRYYNKGGKIVKVERMNSLGEIVSEPFSESISRTLKDPSFIQFFPHLVDK